MTDYQHVSLGITAKLIKESWVCVDEDMRLIDELIRVNVSHMTNELADDLIKPETKCYNHETDNDCESHLVDFPLLNALLPDIKLQRGLKGIPLVTKSLDIGPKPIIDRLEVCNSHEEKTLKCLAQISCR